MLNLKIIIATFSIATMTGPALADNPAAELDAIKTRLAEIENQQHQSAIDATILDSQSRNELLKAEGFTAGWNNGFKFGSGDGKYLMQIYGTLQIRNVTSASNGFFFEDHEDGDGQTINGFEIRRAKVGIKGNAIDPRLGYDVRVGFGRSGGTDLEVAYLKWKASDDWAVKAGQYKANWNHEESTSVTKQLTAERSLLNAALGGVKTEYTQGIAVMFSSDNLRGEFGFSDGADSGNTPWNGELPTGYDFGVEGRFEFKCSGDWKSYDDFSALGNQDDLLVLGAGFDWSSGSDNPGGDGFDLRHTFDIQWENTGGLSLYASYVAMFSDVGDDDDLYHWGAMGQIGYLIGESKWEVFGRYSYMDFDFLDGVDDTYQEITGGVSYYFFNSHSFKFTCDLNFLPDGAPAGTGGLGYVTDNNEQWSLRAQLQLQI